MVHQSILAPEKTVLFRSETNYKTMGTDGENSRGPWHATAAAAADK